MKRHTSALLSFQRWASLLVGSLLVVSGSVYFLTASAKADAVEQAPNGFVSGRGPRVGVNKSGVTVNLSSTSAAATGEKYQFSGLPSDGDDSLSPSFPSYRFTPPIRSFNDLSSNHSSDFEMLGNCQNGSCVANGRIAFDRGG